MAATLRLAEDIGPFMAFWHTLDQQHLAQGMPGAKGPNRPIGIGLVPAPVASMRCRYSFISGPNRVSRITATAYAVISGSKGIGVAV